MISIRNEPGWIGAFTRNEADGAIPNGVRIRKINSEPGDTHPDGTLGTVLGSLKAPPDLAARTGADYGYFVAWDPLPRHAIAIASSRIERA